MSVLVKLSEIIDEMTSYLDKKRRESDLSYR